MSPVYKFSNAGGFLTKNLYTSAIAGNVIPYIGQTVNGGSAGYLNNTNPFNNISDSSLTLSSTPCSWTCSDQGTFYGGAQTFAGGGAASFRFSLNNGNALPAGTYSYSGTQYLFWQSGGVSHDGMYLWAVTPSQKISIVNSISPPDSLNTQITKTGSFTLSSSTTVNLWWDIYDGSTATSMGGRVYNFTITKTA